MRWMVGAFLVMIFGAGGCALGQSGGYVDASAWSANYTEDYIPEFHLETTSGKNLLLNGIQVKEFSRGGTGSSECCSPIPGVGKTIRVVWRIGGRQETRSEWKTYSKDVAIAGATSSAPDAMNFLIVRFFPGHNIEAEFVSESAEPDGKPSPRVDQLFYGRRVMRQMGE
ncbi:hypothetical protein M3I53_23400 [Paraburkholderia sp. CNPSo 3272]|uniref:hypothetical protein n=1 Tax=Paraburkholderia sp. CNPSo 3272 TaxID=2940931 RepID=UPI0020B71E97|nr:hypothetical protein [Paraburkholderia sp. CNPSo 3272]MCP3726038.1 hypothetical protein [Paraburkholderia sp. CNPSo 3272]